MDDGKHALLSSVTNGVDVSMSCAPSTPHYPAHFVKGSVIQLANGELKRVEDLTTMDFVQSADMSCDLRIDTSTVENISPVGERNTVMLTFSVGPQQVEVSVESTIEHPFFVYDRGWSSYNPPRTMQRYHLTCHQLMVGDKCISLTQKKSPHIAVPNSMAALTVRNGSSNNSNNNTNNNNTGLNEAVSCSLPTSSRRESRLRLASDSAAIYNSGQY